MKITIEHDNGQTCIITAEGREFVEAFLLTLEEMRPDKPLRLMQEGQNKYTHDGAGGG